MRGALGCHHKQPGNLVLPRIVDHQERQCGGLGPNADGEQLEPGRVADCYLAILLDQPLANVAPEPGSVLVVGPAALLHREIPQPHGQALYDLLTGHPDRAPRDLVFLADLTVELRAWHSRPGRRLASAPKQPYSRWWTSGALATSRAWSLVR